jgi:hypothetical protein
MDLIVSQVATAVVTVLSPYLLQLVKDGGKKLTEVIAQKGGETAWRQAEKLWQQLKMRADEDGDIEDAARMLGRKPEDENRKKTFESAIVDKLTKDPSLTEDLSKILGGERRIQEIIAEGGSMIEDIDQSMRGSGTQKVSAKDESTIKNVNQSQH